MKQPSLTETTILYGSDRQVDRTTRISLTNISFAVETLLSWAFRLVFTRTRACTHCVGDFWVMLTNTLANSNSGMSIYLVFRKWAGVVERRRGWNEKGGKGNI